MLSVFDLLAAKTLDPDLAAYLMARISTGSSFMAGSVPGGAGKTTVMCALLNFVPVDVPLIAATDQAVYEAANARISPRCACYLCHEIGSGSYFAYLWADALRAYCSRVENGYNKTHRWIEEVYSGDGSSAQELIFHANDKRALDENAEHYLADPEYVAACRDFLTKIPPDVRTIEDTRRQVVEFLRRNNNIETE